MARKKRSPSSRRLTQQIGTTTTAEAFLLKCEICSSQPSEDRKLHGLKENQDYFIESDGNLTVRNGVCPRRLVLGLFSDLSVSAKKYKAMLGENFMKFLLNLSQILKNQKFACPEESSLQAITAQNVIMTYLGSAQLQTSLPRKRSHELSTAAGERQNLRDDNPKPFPETHASHNDERVGVTDLDDMREEDEEDVSLPANFLRLSDPAASSPHKKSRAEALMSQATKHFPSAVDTCSDSNELQEGKESASAAPGYLSGKSGGTVDSRAVSPALSSTDSISNAEGGKQMANTKRGSKILPVSSTNGLTHYVCPVCNLELTNDHELTVHIRSHNQSTQQALPNTCTICGKTLSSQSSLDRHMLVHSGERPFKCKICDMSFTTNGNMHRHSRIHIKNGISVPNTTAKTGMRKSSESKTSKKGSSYPFQKLSSVVSGSGQSQFPPLIADFGDKMDVFKTRHEPDPSHLQYLQYLNMKADNPLPTLHSYAASCLIPDDVNKIKAMGFPEYMFPFNVPRHPAFPMSHMMHDPTRIVPLLPGLMDSRTGEILAKHARLGHHLVPPVLRPSSPDLRSARIFKCTVCSAVFNNEFSLESHMESHVIVDTRLEEESGTACKTCKVVAKSEESLLLHNLTLHKSEPSLAEPDSPSQPASPSAATTSNNNSNNNSCSSGLTGFQGLGFASFTTKKFPLIAKAYCESNPDLKGQRFPVFKCQECDKDFPVEGAKDLHEASHVPEEYTVCPKCDCHFSDSSRLQEHMQKHVSDLKFEEFLEKPDAEANETMSQNYFLIQLGLISKESPADHAMSNVHEEEEESFGTRSLNDAEESMLSEDEEDKMRLIEAERDELESNSSKFSMSTSSKKGDDSSSTRPSLAPSISSHSASKPAANTPSSTPLTSATGKGVELSISPASPGCRSSSLPIQSPSDAWSPTPWGNRSPFHWSSERPDGIADPSQPPMFPCKHCNLVLSNPKELEVHQLSHRSQYECQICSYTSTDKSTLLRHMRTHSGERPYKCRICEYSFTTKANCERHLRQRHAMHKDNLAEYLTCNRYVIASKSLSPSDNNGEQDTTCAACGIDFFSPRALQQHHRISTDCRIGFVCKKCNMPFATKDSAVQHMCRQHSELESQDYEKFLTRVENLSDCLSERTTSVSTPPPAHSKSATALHTSQKMPELMLRNCNTLTGTGMTKGSDNSLKKMNFNLTSHKPFATDNTRSEQPLDFSKQLHPASRHPHSLSSDALPSVSGDSDDDQPMDLSVSSRPSPSPSAPTQVSGQPQGQGLNFLNQRVPVTKKTSKERTSTPRKDNSNSSIPPPSSDNTRSNRNDGNNNQLSPLFTLSPVKSSSSNSNTSVSYVTPLSPAPTSSAGVKVESAGLLLSRQIPKHPAFPQFAPMVTNFTSLLVGNRGKALNFSNIHSHPALAHGLSYMSKLQTSLLGGSPSSAATSLSSESISTTKDTASNSTTKGAPSNTLKVDPEKNSEDKKDGSEPDVKSVTSEERSTDKKGQAPNINERDGSSPAVNLVPSVVQFYNPDNERADKGSPSGSESSCELASVNKILEATAPQSFQDYFPLPETEEEEEEEEEEDMVGDSKSESIMSSEDSNLSMENMYSNSQSFAPGQVDSVKAEGASSLSESGKSEGTSETSLIINTSLIEGGPPQSLMDKSFKDSFNEKIEDPNNMSEQAIADLIEKVSRENVNSPAKKKRNSYADSPHKFTCPYCPRCFPWLSSLNRHLLTHTGQKPFRCPRCPVTFSTKSNRERHLIRKHNVNMLDPASRATMDRPFKCHICVFSSFSTQSNLSKHYADRHNGMTPPANLLEMADRSFSDGEGEDGHGGNAPSYEDEEEFNLSEMRNGLTDKEIMLQNYAQDSDSNHSSSNLTSTFRDPHKKRNAIFNLNSADCSSRPHSASGFLYGSSNTSSSVSKSAGSTGTTRPGIDDTVLTDTMKNFLDKSVRQALEDSHRRAIEEGSTFVITPAIERHLRKIPLNQDSSADDSSITCTYDQDLVNKKLLQKLSKNAANNRDPPFKCYLCESAFTSRVECLQHQATEHQTQWDMLCEKNDIGNLQVFATRLDKKIEKHCKIGREMLGKLEREAEDADNDHQGDKIADEICDDVQNSQVSETLPSKTSGGPDNDIDSLKEKKVMASENHASEGKREDAADSGIIQEVVNSDYLQRKVHCALCSKRFWSLQDLRRHMRSHTGERPFSCKLCTKKFTLKHSLNRHKAKHHSSEDEPVVDGTSDDEDSGSDCDGKSMPSKRVNISSTPTVSAPKENNKTPKANKKDKNDDSDAELSDADMLHNLLGVESSTIDQIFESRDSAASLLGVGEGVNPAV